jgi:hypothetical protein
LTYDGRPQLNPGMERKPTDDRQRDETQWPQWEIVSIRKCGRVLGMVRVPNAETAVA